MPLSGMRLLYAVPLLGLILFSRSPIPLFFHCVSIEETPEAIYFHGDWRVRKKSSIL